MKNQEEIECSGQVAGCIEEGTVREIKSSDLTLLMIKIIYTLETYGPMSTSAIVGTVKKSHNYVLSTLGVLAAEAPPGTPPIIRKITTSSKRVIWRLNGNVKITD